MRVLSIGSRYPPHGLGGYEQVWQGSVRHLRSAGHAVRVLASDHREPEVAEREESDVHRELRSYWRDHEFPSIGVRERVELERHNAAVLERHIDEFEPDVVAWWAMGGMSLSLIEQVARRGLPAAGVVCDEWMIYGPAVDGWLRLADRRGRRGLAERRTGIPSRVDLGAAAEWLFISETLREKSAAAWELPRCRVQHLGAEDPLFAPAARPPWSGSLLYVGRIDPRKGIDLAIEAVGLLDGSSLIVDGAGSGAHLDQLRQLAAGLGLAERVRFTLTPRPDLPALYADADAVLFPVRWQEPWGLVPLEAMAVGTPVIASGRGGSGEYLSDRRNCLISDPDEGAEALAAAVTELSSDEDLRETIRLGGFETTRSIPRRAFDDQVERMLLEAVGEL